MLNVNIFRYFYFNTLGNFCKRVLYLSYCSSFFVHNIDLFVQIVYNLFKKVQRGDDYMATNTTNISIRMDSALKTQADKLFGELGMNLSTAFNIFVRQSLREGRIPFDISLNQPNKDTVEAMLEAERVAKDTSVKGYTDLDKLFADLKS